jgi:hypothetical protein
MSPAEETEKKPGFKDEKDGEIFLDIFAQVNKLGR